MSARHGKIARLPLELREELNDRLLHGQPAAKILPWINALPAAQSILSEQFRGKPISEQNLSEWRVGGFLDWLGLRDWRAICTACADDSGLIAATGFTAGKLLRMLTARLAVALDRADDHPDGAGIKQDNLRNLISTVLKVHESNLKEARLDLDREHFEFQKQCLRSATTGEPPSSPEAAVPKPSPQPPPVLPFSKSEARLSILPADRANHLSPKADPIESLPPANASGCVCPLADPELDSAIKSPSNPSAILISAETFTAAFSRNLSLPSPFLHAQLGRSPGTPAIPLSRQITPTSETAPIPALAQ